LRSSRPRPSARRAVFLRLAGEIEGQLREAYHHRFQAGQINQSSLAERLEVGRSVISRRLNGQTNMTIETIADMAWALDLEVEVTFRDKRAADPASTAPVQTLIRSESGQTR
jgi:plasmid maintenance system antidote protein VapI